VLTDTVFALILGPVQIGPPRQILFSKEFKPA
jgi:hypothetical protein